MKRKLVFYRVESRNESGEWFFENETRELTPQKAQFEIIVRKAAGNTLPMLIRKSITNYEEI
jgi:hypothetical protein